MAHRCGFTPGMLQHSFQALPFGELLLRRRGDRLELMAVARVTATDDDDARSALMSALEL
jgi:hypothetical protein